MSPTYFRFDSTIGQNCLPEFKKVNILYYVTYQINFRHPWHYRRPAR